MVQQPPWKHKAKQKGVSPEQRRGKRKAWPYKQLHGQWAMCVWVKVTDGALRAVVLCSDGITACFWCFKKIIYLVTAPFLDSSGMSSYPVNLAVNWFWKPMVARHDGEAPVVHVLSHTKIHLPRSYWERHDWAALYVIRLGRCRVTHLSVRAQYFPKAGHWGPTWFALPVKIYIYQVYLDGSCSFQDRLRFHSLCSPVTTHFDRLPLLLAEPSSILPTHWQSYWALGHVPSRDRAGLEIWSGCLLCPCFVVGGNQLPAPVLTFTLRDSLFPTCGSFRHWCFNKQKLGMTFRITESSLFIQLEHYF